MTNTKTHQERMEWRNYLIRKRRPRYHVTCVRGDNAFMAGQSNDLDTLLAIVDAKAPAYIVDNWARPTPEVVHVALAKESQVDGYMAAV